MSAVQTAEILSAAQFMDELRHVVRFRQQPAIAQPLNEAVSRIEQNPAFAQSRLLTRIIAALTHQQGEFRRAELDALDAGTFAMVIALMDAHAGGTFTPAQWQLASSASSQAQLDAGG